MRRFGTTHESRDSGLTLSFPATGARVTVVRDFSLRVAEGESVAVVGESGSGKSITAPAITRLVDIPGAIDADTISFTLH